MIEEKPNYYAVIPAHIRYSKKIPDKAKLLYGEITSLCDKDGYCWATNSYFAKLYGISKDRISHLLTILQRENYIKIKLEYDERNKKINRRLIFLITPASYNILNDNGIVKNSDPPSYLQHWGIGENSEDNNTSINNTINILIEFFNKQNVFSKVTKVTESRKKKIKARLRDVGFDNLIRAFEIASKSDFLTGKTRNSNWKADFDWFIANDTNAFKVIEGKYSNTQSKQTENNRYGPVFN